MREAKGLDMVRRDWSPLSKDCGNFALDAILSGRPREDVVDAIHAKLHEVPASPHFCEFGILPTYVSDAEPATWAGPGRGAYQPASPLGL